jgi:hypothetical protein
MKPAMKPAVLSIRSPAQLDAALARLLPVNGGAGAVAETAGKTVADGRKARVTPPRPLSARLGADR